MISIIQLLIYIYIGRLTTLHINVIERMCAYVRKDVLINIVQYRTWERGMLSASALMEPSNIEGLMVRLGTMKCFEKQQLLPD